jgi:PAS domain S-box-containing protein
MREGLPSVVFGYLLAIVFTAAMVALRWLLDPWLDNRLALVTIYAAVAAAVWFEGYRPALLAAIFGYLACDYLFIEPRGGFAFQDVPVLIGLAAYFFTCAFIIGFGEAMRRTRDQAKSRREVMRITLASIGDAVMTTDTEGRVTYLNAVAETLTGWTRAEAQGKPLDAVFVILNEATGEKVENPVTKALRHGYVVGLANHTILIAKDGAERPIDDSAAPIRDERGQVTGCVLVFRDITERRKAELALRRSQHELSDFFENAIVGLHWVGPDGTILRVNQTELDLLGYTREDYIGRPIAEFHVNKPVIDDILARLIRGETLHDYPAQMRCKDGSIRDVLIHSNALFEDGKFIHSRCITRDVTELKRAEEAQALLANIVETTDEVIVSKTLDGIVLSWNAAAERLFGYSAAEVVGQSITLIIPPELRDEETAILERLRQGERVEQFETVRVSKEGRRIDISLTVSPIRDSSGQLIGASKVARDITDRKRVEAALREADRRKDEFLATLAHELRNPLAPIRNALEIMKRAEEDRDMVHQARDVIERQVFHMVRLVDDLLDLGRITLDRLELRRTQVELASILRQAVETCRPLAERENHRIEVVIPQQPIHLDADPVRLAQVFSNLLNNACKYTRQQGTILLSVELEGKQVVVSVKDSGIGIPADKLESIFEMFNQVESTLDQSRGGLGIGLTLVKRLVELHGGSITASSEGLGRGSLFAVRLPVVEGEPEPRPRPAPIRSASEATSHRILVVDDNRDSARALAVLLRLTGHDTQMAHDGQQAVEVAEKFRPNVVLLDIGLPKLNGLDACRQIREQPWGKKITIVALTGWGQEEDRRMSQSAGFDDHMVKPVDPDALLQLLASLPSGTGNTVS